MNMKRVEEIRSNLLKEGLAEKYDHAGVYSISIGDKLVYIGQSLNMLTRIAQHIEAIETWELQTAHKYEVLHAAVENNILISFDVMYNSISQEKEQIHNELGQKEGELIRQFLPPLNYQIPSTNNYKSFTVQRKAKTITLDEIIGHN